MNPLKCCLNVYFIKIQQFHGVQGHSRTEEGYIC